MLKAWKALVEEGIQKDIRNLPFGISTIVILLVAAISPLIYHYSSSRWNGEKEKDEGISTDVDFIMKKKYNLDHAPARRRIREAFKDIQLNLDHPLFKDIGSGGVKTNEVFERDSHGNEIFTKSWFPETRPLKAIIFLCHGYGDTCTFFLEGLAHKLALAGYGVFGMDYPGFGLSEGLHGYIPNFDKLVDSVIQIYSRIKGRDALKGYPCFLFGQSMGGAVALKVHLKQPNAWNGAILVAPMCKISEDIYPPWILFQLLKALTYLIPQAKLVPQANLADLAFQDVRKRKQTAYNVIAYKDKPRLGSAFQLLKATDDISSRLHEVSLPVLILHGADDKVTDPSVSQALDNQACSNDKKLVIYKDAWHSFLEGEHDHVISKVLIDIISWLDGHIVVPT